MNHTPFFSILVPVYKGFKKLFDKGLDKALL